MSDWVGLGIIGFFLLCGIFGLWFLSKPYDITVEEFEKRAREAPSLMSAGLVGLQKILDPATAKAVAAQQDFKEGRFDAKQAKGDGPDEEGGSSQEQTAGVGAGSRSRPQEQSAGVEDGSQEQELKTGAGAEDGRQE